MISRPPRPLVDGETVDLGGKEVRTRGVRHLATPHVPHNWESQVLFRGDHRQMYLDLAVYEPDARLGHRRSGCRAYVATRVTGDSAS
jgi:hypothetical protein